jgi:hypothetical protein
MQTVIYMLSFQLPPLIRITQFPSIHLIKWISQKNKKSKAILHIICFMSQQAER